MENKQQWSRTYLLPHRSIQEKRWRRHFPKSIDRSFETHFALSMSRLLSSFAFLYTFTGRKGACDLFLNVEGGADVV